MTTFYVTSTGTMALGVGCVEIEAADEYTARQLAFKHMPDGRWSFLYDTLAAVHPLDRRILGKITEAGLDRSGDSRRGSRAEAML